MTAIRYFFDEHMNLAIPGQLRRSGVECATVGSVGRAGASDPSHLAWARAQGYVIVTSDEDFLALGFGTTEHAGVVFTRQGALSIGEMLRRLGTIHAENELEDFVGRVHFL